MKNSAGSTLKALASLSMVVNRAPVTPASILEIISTLNLSSYLVLLRFDVWGIVWEDIARGAVGAIF